MISGTEIDVYGNCRVGVNFAVSSFLEENIESASAKESVQMQKGRNL